MDIASALAARLRTSSGIENKLALWRLHDMHDSSILAVVHIHTCQKHITAAGELSEKHYVMKRMSFSEHRRSVARKFSARHPKSRES